MYDAYRNCFRYRPDVQRQLVEAVQRERHMRNTTALHARDAATSSDAALHKEALMMNSTPCRCALDAAQLFATPEDVPNPPLPLSRCELHEVLQALPPRWQCYPWRLCFDTARDGFSLSSLYRHMEAVEAKQSQVRTIAFGLFFAHTHEDAALSSAPATSPMESRSASSITTSYTASPTTAGASHSFREAHRTSSRRYGAAHGALQHNVLGCFAPEVPCLGRHAANIYFGSPDTFVFRLDQLGCAPSRGAWMLTDKETKLQGEQQHQQQRHGEASGSLRMYLPEGSAAETHTCAPATSTAAVGAVPAYGGVSLALADDGTVGLSVPMPSRMTIEHSVGSKRIAGKSIMHPPPLLSPGEGPPFSSPSPPRDIAAISRTMEAMLSVRSASDICVLSPRGRRHRPLRPVPWARVVPQWPLLEKFSWCGDVHNRKYVVCNPRFFAIGGGQSGAALYVDESLQYGTSSLWCETFSAPCLVGPRTRDTDVPPSLPCMQSSQSGAGNPCGGPAHQTSVLPHVEFSISRVVWFSITEDKRKMLMMSTTDASSPSAASHRCGCGRYSCTSDSNASTLDPMSLLPSTAPPPPPASIFLHQCDLLPFSAPL